MFQQMTYGDFTDATPQPNWWGLAIPVVIFGGVWLVSLLVGKWIQHKGYLEQDIQLKKGDKLNDKKTV